MTEQQTLNAIPLVLQLASATGAYQPLFDETNTLQYHSGCVTLNPGDSVGKHSTKNDEEIIVFLEGKGEVCSECWNEPQRVQAPAVAHMAPRTLHSVMDTGEIHCRMCTSSPRYEP